MTQVSLSTSTNNTTRSDALVESLGNTLTFTFTLTEPAPIGGLRVFVDSNVEQIVNRLDLPAFAFNPQVQNIGPLTFATDSDNSGFALTINAGATSASFTIPVFDNEEPDTFLPATFDGRVDALFSLRTAGQVSDENPGSSLNISDYTVNNTAGSNTIIFVDTPDQLPVQTPPTFRITANQTTLIEHEGSRVTFTIDLVDGTLPPSGFVDVRVSTGGSFSLGDFVVLPPDATFTGGSPRSGFSDNSGFTFRVSSSQATISLPVFNDRDLIAGDIPAPARNDDAGFENVTVTLLPPASGSSYAVAAGQGAVQLTLADTRGQLEYINRNYDEAMNGDISNNRLQPTKYQLAEGDNELKFSIDGEVSDREYITINVPEGFQLNSLVLQDYKSPQGNNVAFMAVQQGTTFTAPPSLLNAETDALLGYVLFGPESSTQGAASAIVGQNLLDDLGSTTDGSGNKGTQGFSGPLPSGDYSFWIQQLDDQAQVSLKFEVAPAQAPNQAPVANNDTNSTTEDTAVSGNVLTNDTDANGDTLSVTAIDGSSTNLGTPITLASGAQITLNANGSYSYNPNGQFESLNNGQSATDSFQYTIADGQGGTSTATATITVNGVTDTVTTTPIVSFSTTPTIISEAEGTALVMSFNVQGEIPAEGITVNLQGDAARIMQQFTVAQTRFNAAGEPFYRFDN
ncbi:MAG: cadherin-like domain-containing protein, partial [Leptolyngbyaceae cyanobacterium CRU_2_3]|nr:cadherin-like domain-containing protein [Leptolyngbyaceae cyanobacterium CRU_2_3]